MYLDSSQIDQMRASLEEVREKIKDITPSEGSPNPASLTRAVTGREEPFYALLDISRELRPYKRYISREIDKIKRHVMRRLRGKLPASGKILEEMGKLFIDTYGPDDSNDWGVSKVTTLSRFLSNTSDDLDTTIFGEEPPTANAPQAFSDILDSVELLEDEIDDTRSMIDSLSKDTITLLGIQKLERQSID